MNFLRFYLVTFNSVPLRRTGLLASLASTPTSLSFLRLTLLWRSLFKSESQQLVCSPPGQKGDMLDRPSELWPQGQTLSASDWQLLNHLAPVKDRYQECKPGLITEKICHCHMVNESGLLLLVNDRRALKGIICYRD